MTRALLGGLAGHLALAMHLAAQSGTVTLELTGSLQSLSGPYGDGGGAGLRATWAREPDVWTAFASHERRFDASGTLAGIANTHTFSADWYSYVAAAASTDVFFLPRYRFDGQLARKLGGHRQWVATSSVMVSAAHDEHRDLAGGIGLIRYFGSGLILDGAVVFNRSMPGEVISRRQTVAATYVQAQRHTITGRVSWGREAYQLTGASTAITGFSSHELSVRYQRWLTSNAGATITAEYYDNPYYHRTGLYLAIFRRYGQ